MLLTQSLSEFCGAVDFLACPNIKLLIIRSLVIISRQRNMSFENLILVTEVLTTWLDREELATYAEWRPKNELCM